MPDLYYVITERERLYSSEMWMESMKRAEKEVRNKDGSRSMLSVLEKSKYSSDSRKRDKGSGYNLNSSVTGIVHNVCSINSSLCS